MNFGQNLTLKSLHWLTCDAFALAGALVELINDTRQTGRYIEIGRTTVGRGVMIGVLRIQNVAVDQLVEVRHQTKLGLRYALSHRKHFQVEMDVRPVQVMVPFEGSAAHRLYGPVISIY